jgi:hypothetical protein
MLEKINKLKFSQIFLIKINLYQYLKQEEILYLHL